MRMSVRTFTKRGRRRIMARPLPAVTGREVIFGGGYHAAVYAVTRTAMGYEPPIVFEQNLTTGGIFSQLQEFRLNSAMQASVESVASPNPTRVVSASPLDDLNWIPNSPHQVSSIAMSRAGMSEYPSSFDMCRAIQLTLKDNADVFTGVKGCRFNRAGDVFSPEGVPLGTAKRVIFAGGTTEKWPYKASPSVISGIGFLRKPRTDLAGLRIALVGAGDTAAQVAEYMLGQGMTYPNSLPDTIHWYGKDDMPSSKESWMKTKHARWAGLGRHFPQTEGFFNGVIKPFPTIGTLTPMGNSAMVNDRVYDLAVMAIGVIPAGLPVVAEDVLSIGGMNVARTNASDTFDGIPMVYRVGTAANLNATYRPFRSRFSAARNAMYVLGPRTAALAAFLD